MKNKIDTNEAMALDVLATVKAELGRNYKSAIRDAWMDGNYSDRGLSAWSSQLQNIRNNFGPSWLVKAQPKAIQIIPSGPMITLHKGGISERKVELSKVKVPDLWHIAMESQPEIRERILECWHLAHDLRRELTERLSPVS